MTHLSLILISVLLTALGQLFFKKGMMEIAARLPQASLWKMIGCGLLNLHVLLGFLAFGSGALLWLAVLAREELSYAYPLSSLGYLAVLFGSYFFFLEKISLSRIIGVLVIMAGVFLVEYSR
jgi:multidrug transporter EmrE-like cation transporter